jgi:hypothetical protein
LTPLEVVSLTSGLRADAADFYYSGWVSFLDALNGINKGFYTWATVKLYYSVFYAFRASLANDDVCVFHVDNSSFTVLAQVGTQPVSCTDRGTHKTVLKTFQRRNPTHPLVSQKIDLKEAVDWLVGMRESANYSQARFIEPDCGNAFEQVNKYGLRKLINAYVAELLFPYVFDPDHAIVAYPLRTLQLIGAQLVPAALPVLSEDEQLFLKNRARDKSGTLSAVTSELRRLTLLT